MVKAIVKVLPSVEGADIVISGTGGVEISGETTQHIDQAGDVIWEKVYIPGDGAVLTITRKDNDASSVITFEKFDLNGIWNGTFTITDIILDETGKQAAAEQGCNLDFIEALKGAVFPLRLDITVDEGGNGTGTMLLDTSSVSEEGGGSAQTMDLSVTYAGNTVDFQVMSSEMAGATMTGAVSRKGDALVMEGSFSATDQGITMTAAWTVTKQE
jgi:hypothetical protein